MKRDLEAEANTAAWSRALQRRAEQLEAEATRSEAEKASPRLTHRDSGSLPRSRSPRSTRSQAGSAAT